MWRSHAVTWRTILRPARTNGRGEIRTHDVRALVRDPDVLGIMNDRMVIVSGEALVPEDVARVVMGADLLAGERTDEFRLERERLPEKGTSISVEDSDGFLVAQIDSADYEQGRVGIAY